MRLQHLHDVGRMLQEQALRHLDLEALGGQPGLREHLGDRSCRYPAQRNCAAEKFTADRPRVEPCGGILAGLAQHPFAERPDQPGLLRHGQEIARREDAFARPLPAHQRLVAAQAAGGELELRLIEDDELVALKRLPESRSSAALALHALLHLRVEEGNAFAPSAFALESAVSAARKSMSAFSALTG